MFLVSAGALITQRKLCIYGELETETELESHAGNLIPPAYYLDKGY